METVITWCGYFFIGALIGGYRQSSNNYRDDDAFGNYIVALFAWPILLMALLGMNIQKMVTYMMENRDE